MRHLRASRSFQRWRSEHERRYIEENWEEGVREASAILGYTKKDAAGMNVGDDDDDDDDEDDDDDDDE